VLRATIIVDEKKVEELLGVPPEKVVGLHGTARGHHRQYPGAKGIGEKAQPELIRKYGSVETALDHAAEVSTSRYRKLCSSSANKC